MPLGGHPVGLNVDVFLMPTLIGTLNDVIRLSPGHLYFAVVDGDLGLYVQTSITAWVTGKGVIERQHRFQHLVVHDDGFGRGLRFAAAVKRAQATAARQRRSVVIERQVRERRFRLARSKV